jgi:hypothetical protein
MARFLSMSSNPRKRASMTQVSERLILILVFAATALRKTAMALSAFPAVAAPQRLKVIVS